MEIDPSAFHDHLVRGLAHRMNNILTLFHGYLGLLMDNQQLDQDSRDGLARIKQGALTASDLIDRTYSLVQPRTPGRRQVHIGELLTAIQPLLNAVRARTKLAVQVGDDLPTVKVEVGHFKKTIIELVKNAVEAGAKKITIAAQARDGMLQVTVRDDGIGIAQDIRGRIFQPFFTTRKKDDKAGLGLAIAMAFARQHHGTLDFQSEPRATVFTLALPPVP